MISQLSESGFEARCKTHDQFFDRFRRANAPASKFAAKIAADHGRVFQYRQVSIKKTVMRETHVVELKNWQVFRGVIGVDRCRMELLEALREYGVALGSDTNRLTATEFRQLRRKLDQLADGLADLDRRLRSLVGFCQGDGLTHFVELWNAQAPAGFELAIIEDKLVSGAETIPTEIPLAA